MNKMGAGSSLRAFNFNKALEIEPDTYYRSRIHTFTTGVNPLVAAGQALIGLLTRLPTQSNTLQYDPFVHDLTHEFKTFVSRCQENGYNTETQTLARYVLCAAFDESIQQHATSHNEAQYPSLISLFFPDKPVITTLPMMLMPLLENAMRHVDLLEFCFIVMSVSFNPRHAEADMYLEPILEKMYAVIRQVRGDAICDLFITPKSTRQEQAHAHYFQKVLLGTVIAGVIVLYGAFNYLLSLNTHLLPTMPSTIASYATEKE